MNAKPVRRPRDTWDWLTIEDAERIAFTAFFEACRQQGAPAGQPFVLDGSPWSSREDFRDSLIGMFAQRVNALGLDRGVTGVPSCVHSDLPAGFHWPDAEAMAQGCAAVAVGAGAPPAQAAGSGATDPAGPLFLGLPGQQLPPGDGPSHTETSMGAISA